MTKPLLSSPTRWALRAVIVVVLGLVAANFIDQWWFWERRAPALGFPVGDDQRLSGRVALIWAATTLLAGFAALDLLTSLPRWRRRSLVMAGIGAALAIVALMLGRLT